jgi:hypothetical protein
MYRNCIFCSGDLGRNEALETFPVGRSVAFDARRGRLWAVCPRCGRWNLAPLEERWEAVERAEQRFQEARKRVHSENVGLARLEEGTRLIRIGAALPGEFAAWRYGRKLRRRLRRSLALMAGAAAIGLGAVSGSAAAVVALPLGYGWILTEGLLHRRRTREVLHLLGDGDDRRPLRRIDVARVTLGLGDNDELAATVHRRRNALRADMLTGAEARSFLARMLPGINRWGGSAQAVRVAMELIERTGSPATFLRARGREGISVRLPEVGSSSLDLRQLFGLTRSTRRGAGDANGSEVHPLLVSLALEIALSEESERRALDGELRGLTDRWREAEEIASIADILPDDPLRRWRGDRV